MRVDVSIIITTFNYSQYIGGCIRSCLQQQCPEISFEVIVVDDGSTDDTQDILAGLDHELLSKYLINNSGIEKASNFGISKASGDYIVRVDADDLLCSNYLEVLFGYLNEGAAFMYPDYFVIDEAGKTIAEMTLPEFNVLEIRQRGDFLATGTLYRADALAKVSCYNDKNRNCGLENYELILNMLEAGMDGFHVPIKLFKYRRHSENISVTSVNRIISFGVELFRARGLGDYGTNSFHPYGLRL